MTQFPLTKSRSYFSKARAHSLPLAVSLLLAACATAPADKPEVLVHQRATARWQALVKGDFVHAYSYSTPAFKAIIAADAYKQRFGSAQWYDAEVISVTCPEPTACTARMRIDFKYLAGGKSNSKITTHFDESWLLEDGKWWYFEKI